MTECDGAFVKQFRYEWNKEVKRLNPKAHEGSVIEEPKEAPKDEPMQHKGRWWEVKYGL